MKLAVALDYDGVLVDSYRGIPVFYIMDLPVLTGAASDYARQLLYLEYLAEGIGLLREELWPRYIPGFSLSLYDELITRYWERRMEYSHPLPGVRHALKLLMENDVDLYHVGHRDDIYGLKEHRVEVDGFSEYFKTLYIVEENTRSRLSALLEILEDYDAVVYVDDKPVNLAVIDQGLGEYRNRVTLVRNTFRSEYDAPWMDPVGKYRAVNNLLELVRLVKELRGKP
ncbi:HAD family hydrolase [Desulfurococcus mucosus]|uniref:Haloacid dehalogenase domain protein hydrolase n=1 Tax=Desulfurococcus mucosus (strain ATCC 35584 / DSM 2162 / JCM 9187 / O7/1) TaxID=765177 RepID=E8R9M1_DESM0|nr:phosphatase [Desulfurococcus mucosus]ADV65197.1 hypothetical protein Desmu_0893 [Desulfurococcus mucosus DSM 2162]